MIAQKNYDSQALAQSELEKYINSLFEDVAPEFEIDSIPENLRELYRVWHSSHLLGTFYQNIQGKWIAQPCSTDKQFCCETPSEAQALIIAVSKLLVNKVAQQFT